MRLNMKINFKEEKGSITVFVVSIMIFIITVLGITYINVINKLSAEEKKIDRIQAQYSTDDINERYEETIQKMQ